MIDHAFNVPILFLIFNRPDTTQQVFNEIRKAKPMQLFVAADGPRKDRSDDIENCRMAREIINQVDWDCKVSTLFREENLGCKYGVSSAIDWFFSNVEEGIILEDDCVPDQSFFPFCQELLERYRDDKRIMMISGDNFLFGRRRIASSYYFSQFVHIWGWASWKRAWKHYDVEMKLWPTLRDENWLTDSLDNKSSVSYWTQCFEDTYMGKIDTWDYQWVLACWTQHGLSIMPTANLISNIGGGGSATHPSTDTIHNALHREAVVFPLTHPEFIIRDNVADTYVQEHSFRSSYRVSSFLKTLASSIKKWMFH